VAVGLLALAQPAQAATLPNFGVDFKSEPIQPSPVNHEARPRPSQGDPAMPRRRLPVRRPLRLPLRRSRRRSMRWSGATTRTPPSSSPSRRRRGSPSTSRNTRGPAPASPSSSNRSRATGTCWWSTPSTCRASSTWACSPPGPRGAAPGRPLPRGRARAQHPARRAVFAVTEKFGYNTVSFNSETVDPADMESCRPSCPTTTRAHRRLRLLPPRHRHRCGEPGASTPRRSRRRTCPRSARCSSR
jgi:hypothetical protein